MSRNKYYVVWKGRETGIFSDWETCSAQVQGYPGAEYKAFETLPEAERALAGEYAAYAGKPASNQRWLLAPNPPAAESVVVDAACSRNRGLLEWRGLHLASGQVLFHRGPYEQGSNNIGEFLSIVQALSLLERKGLSLPVYSDSETAILWVRGGKSKTRLPRDERNAPLFELLGEAEDWLKKHPGARAVFKWDTAAWGENPADFNRK